MTVRVLLEGDIETSYTKADNSPVIATDTVKNTIYSRNFSGLFPLLNCINWLTIHQSSREGEPSGSARVIRVHSCCAFPSQVQSHTRRARDRHPTHMDS